MTALNQDYGTTETLATVDRFDPTSVSYDTLIAGAGLIGSAIAWILAKAGLRVILADAAKFGNEASASGAGMLAPGGEYWESSPAAQLALQSLALYPAFIRALEKDSGVPIDFRRCGTIELAYERERWESLQKRADAQRKFGVYVDSISTSTLRELVPGLSLGGLRGALYYEDDSCVAPLDLLKALKIACERSGVTILEQTPVKSIHVDHDGVAVALFSGRIKTRSAVLAAGAWSSQIPISHSEASVSIPATFPVKGHIVGYQLPAASLAPILRHGQHYVLQRREGFTLAGSSEERCGFDRRINVELVREIHAGACSFYSPLLIAKPIREWIGFRPATDENEPIIRRIPASNLWLAYGHYRNGILLTPATAHLVADEILCEMKETRSCSREWIAATS